MTIETGGMAAFWTPEGMAHHAEPNLGMRDFALWIDGLKEAGWSLVADTHDDDDEEFPRPSVANYRVWRRGSLDMVEVWAAEQALTTFFVAERHRAAFYATAWPSMLACRGAAYGGRAHARLLRVAAAFVRYGHGIETARWNGEETRDEAERARAREETRRELARREHDAEAAAAGVRRAKARARRAKRTAAEAEARP